MNNKEIQNKTNRPKRVPLWLPYLNSIQEKPKGVYNFEYNGGVEQSKLDTIQSIMIYGDSDVALELKTIENIARHGIPIIIHRRNIAQPVYITSGPRADKDDTLSYQIIARNQSRKVKHIARQLLIAKINTNSWLINKVSVPPFLSLKRMRNIEATHAQRYWKEFFSRLGYPEYSRRGNNLGAQALDACTKFLSGIILRWITYHHMSPYHGFLHEPTTYPALVFDLLEPYRGSFEKLLFLEWIKKDIPPDKWLPVGINTLKKALNTKVYTGLTRQIVTRQELLHGVVLSLKYYLTGKQRKFLIPLETKPNGGRPPKVDFLLYGRHAGKTDFWQEAKRISSSKDAEV
jgi:hypothetical protein